VENLTVTANLEENILRMAGDASENVINPAGVNHPVSFDHGKNVERNFRQTLEELCPGGQVHFFISSSHS